MSDLLFLGAGFSKYLKSDMPLMSDLGEEIQSQKFLEELYNEDFKRTKNVESFMSYLNEDLPFESESQFLRKRAASKELSKFIWDQISSRCAGYRVENELNHKFFYKLLKSSSSVITLNYDLLLEAGFGSSGRSFSNQRWDLLDAYVAPFAPLSSRDGVGAFGQYPATLMPKIYKLHGSINWYYSGRDSFYGEQLYVNDDVTKNSLWADKVPLIIPPTFSKSPYFNNETIRFLWRSACDELRKCSRLIMFGYSMPQSDSVIKTMLENCLNREAKVLVVNPDEAVFERVKSSLKGRTIEHVASSEEFVRTYVADTK